MGIYDRDYSHTYFRDQRIGRMRMTFPKLTPVVKKLLIINVAVFLVSIIIPQLGGFIYEWGQIDATSLSTALQPWRLITYQFLHDQQWVMHIIFNMLGLYFLGPTLERHFSGKKFLRFYLGCGAAGALFYLFLVAINFLRPLPMVGASGSILGLLAACAILFPHFVVFIVIFPVPMPVCCQ